MKIQLKRSSALDGSAAKEPTALQMEYGELAVNFNQNDPAVFIKDNADNIIRIGGIGNIADDGQTEIPSSITPPTDPKPGNFWYNPEDGRLYYYYEDVNSSQWVDASPDSQNNPVESGDTFPAVALPDDLFFNTTDGRIYIYYKDDNSSQWIDASPDTQPLTTELWQGDASKIFPKNSGDSVEIGGTSPGNANIELNSDGTITAAGNIQTGGDSLTGGNDGIVLAKNGTSYFSAADGLSTINSYTTGNSTPTVQVFADGSATFAGTVTANGSVLTRAGGITLDVGDRLEKADAALKALKTAAAAASDFAALKSAIATALADI